MNDLKANFQEYLNDTDYVKNAKQCIVDKLSLKEALIEHFNNLQFRIDNISNSIERYKNCWKIGLGNASRRRYVEEQNDYNTKNFFYKNQCYSFSFSMCCRCEHTYLNRYFYIEDKETNLTTLKNLHKKFDELIDFLDNCSDVDVHNNFQEIFDKNSKSSLYTSA